VAFARVASPHRLRSDLALLDGFAPNAKLLSLSSWRLADECPAIGSNSLPGLAANIIREHEGIQNASHVVLRAINLGKLLIEAKNHDGQYGKWATWLKENCKEMSERTAQRYMDLAIKEKELRAKLPWKKSENTIRHGVADLTLNEACGLIKEQGDNREPKSPHDKYVTAEGNLIEKLKALGSAVAIKEAADQTLRRLNAAVADLGKA
jgi:hypothetical protein